MDWRRRNSLIKVVTRKLRERKFCFFSLLSHSTLCLSNHFFFLVFFSLSSIATCMHMHAWLSVSLSFSLPRPSPPMQALQISLPLSTLTDHHSLLTYGHTRICTLSLRACPFTYATSNSLQASSIQAASWSKSWRQIEEGIHSF